MWGFQAYVALADVLMILSFAVTLQVRAEDARNSFHFALFLAGDLWGRHVIIRLNCDNVFICLIGALLLNSGHGTSAWGL